MLAHPFSVFCVQEQSAHTEQGHWQATAAKSSQGHNVITWAKQNQKGLQPSSRAAHDKPKYQFSERQDLNLSCSAAQQTLCLTSLWLMPRRRKFLGNTLCWLTRQTAADSAAQLLQCAFHSRALFPDTSMRVKTLISSRGKPCFLSRPLPSAARQRSARNT